MEVIDAKGLDCPKPVVMAKKALAEHEKFLVVVDNEIAVENLTKLGNKMNAAISVVEESAAEFKVKFEKKADSENLSENQKEASEQKTYLISSDTMGAGDRDLGKILIKAFISTLKELDPLPAKIIFLNSGVKLALLEADVSQNLKELEELGVEILLCGTCIDYYDLKDQLDLGELSNMYEIAASINQDNVVEI